MNKKIIVLGAFLLVFMGLFSSIANADVFGDASDVSIDRVKANGKALAEGKTNFLEDEDNIDVQVGLTATEDVSNIHVEAVLTDLATGNTVADSSGTFTLNTNQSTLVALNLKLIDVLKRQKDFRLEIKVVDVEGGIEQKSFGLRFTGAKVAGAREELGISIDSVEIEGDTIAENENNLIIVDEGEKKLSLKVRMTALEDVEDAHIDAVLAFENGDVVADATSTFDINDGENAVKGLELPLIAKFVQNSFKLRVKVVDAEGDSEERLYGLKISKKEFPFAISSISLSPEDNAEAGKSIVATLKFKNSGLVPLEGITAKVGISELGISSTKFVDNIKNSNLAEAKEDFILKIPDNAATGDYTVSSEIVSQFGDSEFKELPVFVLGKSEQPRQAVNDKLVINVPITAQDIRNDGSRVAYPMILTNEGPDANTYTLLLDGANWADLSLSESNVFIIKPKESKTINIYASSKEDVIGEQIFVVTIKSNDKVLKQISLKGNVVAAKGLLAAKLENLLGIAFISIVVLFAAIALLFGVRKYLQRGSESAGKEIPDQEEGEAYY